ANVQGFSCRTQSVHRGLREPCAYRARNYDSHPSSVERQRHQEAGRGERRAMLTKDQQVKRERGYVEAKSIVWTDGREKLVGRDWRKRKEELWLRCGGRCE